MTKPRVAAFLLPALLALSAAAPAQDPGDPAGVAVADLEKAFLSRDEDQQFDALRSAGSVDGKGVTAAIGHGLLSKSRAVRQETLRILGRRRDGESLDTLHALYRGDRTLPRDEETFALLLRSIGRHSDPSSLAILAHEPFRDLTLASGMARIYGASRIRTNASLEALIEGRRKADGETGRGRRNGTGGQRFDGHFRVALAVLTGVDMGNDRADWEKWWRENRRTFRVSPERPAIPASLRATWEEYWGESYDAAGAAVDAVPQGCPVVLLEDPGEERVKEAIATLEEAFAATGEDVEALRVATIEAQACVLDERVMDWIAVHLRQSSDLVRIRAVNALGWTRHPRALELMLKAYDDIPDLHEDEDLFAQLLKSIGRAGDPAAFRVLTDRPFRGLTLGSGTARILGVARIREKRSVEQLLEWMQMGGSRTYPGELRPRFMIPFRVALASLTGVDLGSDRQAWLDWWKDAKKSFQVSDRNPPLPRELRLEWESYWGEPWR